MRKRAKILRDTTQGPGLLMMEGQQYRFSPEAWKSDAPPRPGLVVDVELGAQGAVQSITVVPDVQLQREQAEATSAATPNRPPSHSLHTSSTLIQLAAAGLLAATWSSLTAVNLAVPFPGKVEFTFWQILVFLNSGTAPELLDAHDSSSTGLYGVAAIVALAVPFLRRFWKSRLSLLGGLFPLLFMIAVAITFRRSVENINTISLDIGTYLSILIGLYLAFAPLKTFLVSQPKDAKHPESTQEKAA
ncbi:MAG TPA: hypothetical protein VNW47_02820 [Terriglobales bacterium]|jgi:hypothetical protein|nr:hypothetical protein [Terriglobales bacterium]